VLKLLVKWGSFHANFPSEIWMGGAHITSVLGWVLKILVKFGCGVCFRDRC
jgi:hypothetical protein